MCRVCTNTEDDIIVSLQCLNNLFGLQVPNVDLLVLRTGDNILERKEIIKWCIAYLSLSDGEIGKHAVLFIDVTLVNLSTTSLRIIPKFNCAIKTGGEYKSSIWRESDKGDRRVVLIYKGFQTLTGSCIPDSTKQKYTNGNELYDVTISRQNC